MSATAPAIANSRPLLRQVGWVLLWVGAILAAANAVLFMNIAAYGHPGIKARFLATEIAAWAHTMGGAIAVLIGPWQLLTRLRARRPRLHVWMGRVYLLAVLGGALGGLYFAPTSVGGAPGMLGFSVLAGVWLATGAMAYSTIRRGDVRSHRRWMIRNYALTFAAATLRIELGAMQLAGVSFATAFAIVAWSSWVLNWAAVEVWLRRHP